MSDKRDFYDLLGVPRTASDDDIRSAYRAQAREHHPDLNPENAEAPDRIRAINEAYEVLRDPAKRSAYDRFGHAGVSGRGAQSATVDLGDLGDIFEQFFGFRTGGRRQPDAPRRGGDQRAQVSLSFEEAVAGATRQIQVRRHEACETCTGSGAAPGSQPVACATCQGTGKVRRVQQSIFGSFVNMHTCSDCRGQGMRPGEVCAECHGQRRIEKRRSLEVDIPAGVEDGTQIRLTGEGDHGLNGGPSGDLYVALDVAHHAIFDRRGNEIHVELWLNPAEAALGAELDVPTLDGTSRISIPAGTQTGDEIRLEGLGVPYLRRRGRGSQVVTAFVRTPEKLDRAQRELMESLLTTLPPAHVARREQGIWERIREKFS